MVAREQHEEERIENDDVDLYGLGLPLRLSLRTTMISGKWLTRRGSLRKMSLLILIMPIPLNLSTGSGSSRRERSLTLI